MDNFYTGDAMTRLDRTATVAVQETTNTNDGWPPLAEPPSSITSEHARAVFMCLYRQGATGFADFELEALLPDISPSSVRSRRAELEYDGFVESCPLMRSTPRGRSARVYRISRRSVDFIVGRSRHQPNWTHGTGGRRNSIW